MAAVHRVRQELDEIAADPSKRARVQRDGQVPDTVITHGPPPKPFKQQTLAEFIAFEQSQGRSAGTIVTKDNA